MCDSVDYRRPGAWEGVRAAVLDALEPRPAAPYGHVHCEPGWSWRTRLRDYDLWCPLQGHGRMRLAGRTYEVAPGTIFLLRPGDEPWATQDPGDRLTVAYTHLDFYAAGGADPAGVPGRWLPSRHVGLGDPARAHTPLVRAVQLLEQPEPLAEVEVLALLRQALVELYRQDARQQAALARPDRRIARVAAHVRSHPSDRLSLAQAADMAELSPAYFSRLFRRETGQAFRSYVLEARLERARTLLDETDMPVTEIARALGYDEVFLLSRQFSRRFGVPPSRARRR